MTTTPTSPDRQPSRVDSPFDLLALTQLVHFVRWYWLFILSCGLAASVAAGLFIWAFVPRSYEAVATLVIISPEAVGGNFDLRRQSNRTGMGMTFLPPTLTLQGYQTLLESDAVLAETAQRLITQQAIPEGTVLQVGGALQTHIFVNEQHKHISLAPMLQAQVVWKTPEQAAVIANTWAEVFLEHTRTIMRGTTSEAVQFVEREYPQAQEQLATLEEERLRKAEAFEQQEGRRAAHWREKIAAFETETAQLLQTFDEETAELMAAQQDETAALIAAFETETDLRTTAFHNETAQLSAAVQQETATLTAVYQTETTRVVEQLSGQRNIQTRTGQLSALQKAHVELQGEQVRTNSRLRHQQSQLQAARQQLAATPPSLTFHKAISDDVLWQTQVNQNGTGVDWTALQDRSLVSQELNPLYSELSSSVSQIELEVNALLPRKEQLGQELKQLEAQLHELEATLKRDEAELDKLNNDRAAGLTHLDGRRNLALTTLERERAQQLAALRR